MGRIVLIMGGGDWADASVDDLKVPAEMDLDAELEKWRKWYREEYVPAHRTSKKPIYKGFVTWLLERGAERAELEGFWDG